MAIVKSGHIFNVTTDDPQARPPPSMELLELQWHISRIATIQGAFENQESDDGSDGDSVAVHSDPRSPMNSD
ncbi:hypothetical protein N7466_009470 [Penicillium verhagenii]|uniref:uncharacterized protein n=1 Tax=Penicillium verhagenii TaxID=1562060 RepID=UPI0025458B46|nr:uncharacterized protein N7466_009470 [Penicillium verhagenii]KAJ5921144.1 hypothetical protein N7466_009470 [Penicillium verhagenii]